MKTQQAYVNAKAKPCPASLFYQTLILMFAPEPKQFLIDSLEYYLKPLLIEVETQ